MAPAGLLIRLSAYQKPDEWINWPGLIIVYIKYVLRKYLNGLYVVMAPVGVTNNTRKT